MTSEEAQQLLSTAEAMLSQVMRFHDLAVRLTAGTQTPQSRMDKLFSRHVVGSAATTIRPYRQEAPGISFGFEDADTASILLREIAGDIGYNKLQIEVERIGQSRWLTLEVDLPWPSIRQSDRIELTISGSASKELACSARLAAIDFNNNRVDLGWTWITLPPAREPVSAKLEYGLAESHALNFKLEPKLVLFFPVEPFVLDLDYIELKVGD